MGDGGIGEDVFVSSAASDEEHVHGSELDFRDAGAVEEFGEEFLDADAVDFTDSAMMSSAADNKSLSYLTVAMTR